MKRLIIGIVALAAFAARADVRLPEYGQVDAVSGAVERVAVTATGNAAAIAAVDEKVSALTPTESYPGTCRVTFTIGGETPSGAVAEEMLENAAIRVTIGNNVTRYPLTSLAIGTTVSTLVTVSGSIAAYVELDLNDSLSKEQYLYTKTFKRLVEGGNYTIPITLRKADRDLFAIGRAQKISDVSTMQSFLITRDCASTNGYAPVTLFGYYRVESGVTTWIDETGVRDSHPTIADGVITGTQGDFETRIFPWCEAEKRTVTLNFTPSAGNNNFYFTWVPMYYWKFEDIELPFRTYNADTEIWTTNSVACRVHWVSKTQLPGYTIPPWGFIHAYENGVWTTKGVKDGFYYARYDSADKDGRIQSAPFPTMNAGWTRAETTRRSHLLNAQISTVTSPTAGTIVYQPDGSNRLWAGHGYENYAPFRELAYIQFGASMKSVLYGGARQNLDALESAFETAGDEIKTFVTGSGSAANGAWLWIWNPFYMSEGSVCVDASYVARKDESGNNHGEWWVCPDRAADIGGATTIEALLSAGAFKLGYEYNATGKTNRESSRCIDETTIQSSIYWFPGSTKDKCCVRATDEAGWYGGFPADTGANVYGTWLCSTRGQASQCGLWYVNAFYAPSGASADGWGSRPSFAPWKAEGEARSE